MPIQSCITVHKRQAQRPSDMAVSSLVLLHRVCSQPEMLSSATFGEFRLSTNLRPLSSFLSSFFSSAHISIPLLLDSLCFCSRVSVGTHIHFDELPFCLLVLKPRNHPSQLHFVTESCGVCNLCIEYILLHLLSHHLGPPSSLTYLFLSVTST